MGRIQSLRSLILSTVVLLTGAGWILISAREPGSHSTARIEAPQRGFYAPDFKLSTPGGESFTLSELRGRPVLINLWASWCSPCRAEMPAIEKIYQEYRTDGFIVLAINATNQDSVDLAVSFAKQYGLTFPILLDLDGSISRQYQLQALPSSFFIGRDGMIQEVVIGGPMAEALLRTRVERLLEDKP